MVIISKAILRDFSAQYPEAHTAIFKWSEETEAANWKDFNEVKKSFNSVDAVGNDRYVFNIKGNHFRLIALIIFRIRTVFILFIGPHGEYDKLKAADVKFKG